MLFAAAPGPKDEAVLIEYMNEASEDVKFVIAPHKIDSTKIESFRRNIKKETILFSEFSGTSETSKGKELKNSNVLIVDTIGLLTKIYSYADIAYVGGAMGSTGLHNILEPATFGVPIVIGKNYKKFPEAIKMRHLAGLFSVLDAQEFSEIMKKLVADKSFRSKTGMVTEHFINSNTGATQKIMTYITKLHRDGLI